MPRQNDRAPPRGAKNRIDAQSTLRSLIGHEGTVFSVAILPDGLRALSGGQDNTVRLWDLETGTELRRAENSLGITSVVVHPDGRRALFGCGYSVVL
jgi:WD40 repeat protein